MRACNSNPELIDDATDSLFLNLEKDKEDNQMTAIC